MKAVKLKAVPTKQRIYIWVVFLTVANKMIQYLLVALCWMIVVNQFVLSQLFIRTFSINEGDFEMFHLCEVYMK